MLYLYHTRGGYYGYKVQPDKIKEAPDLQWITTKVFGICIYANRSC